jgi:hypothetical protein
MMRLAPLPVSTPPTGVDRRNLLGGRELLDGLTLGRQTCLRGNHKWLRSNSYPHHQISESSFTDELGSGHALSITLTGLAGKPDLIYVAQVYNQRPYAAVQVHVRNTTDQQLAVQAIRSVEAVGDPLINLGGHPSSDRILSDSFSEDWPQLCLYDLGKAPGGGYSFLRQIWVAGNARGGELPRSHAEVQLAQNHAKSKSVMLAANIAH